MTVPPPPPGSPLRLVAAWHRAANDAVAARLRIPLSRPELAPGEIASVVRRVNVKLAGALTRMRAAVEAMDAQGEASLRWRP